MDDGGYLQGEELVEGVVVGRLAGHLHQWPTVEDTELAGDREG